MENIVTQKLALKIFEGFSIQRWNDLIRPFDIVEMDKAAEKMVLAYIIGKYEENKGTFIDWEWMIYASLFDLLKKIALCDIKAPIQQMLKKEYAEEYANLNKWVLNQYQDLINDNTIFQKFNIYINQKNGISPIPNTAQAAAHILSAADKFATIRELQMMFCVNEPERIEKIFKELNYDLQQYLDLTGLQMLITRQRSFDFLMKIEQLRFQTRWNQTPRIPKTSVLGHCFFVAIMTLLLCRASKSDMCKERMINNYFCALFHDLPEAVTRDIISPVKQATDGLPDIVKCIEAEIVKKELVPLMEPFFAHEIIYFINNEFNNRIIDEDKKIKKVSWEELNSKYNFANYFPIDGKTIRIADHLAAILEADSSIKHGITSSHLKEGRKGILKTYNSGCTINGIDAGNLFREIIAD